MYKVVYLKIQSDERAMGVKEVVDSFALELVVCQLYGAMIADPLP